MIECLEFTSPCSKRKVLLRNKGGDTASPDTAALLPDALKNTPATCFSDVYLGRTKFTFQFGLRYDIPVRFHCVFSSLVDIYFKKPWETAPNRGRRDADFNFFFYSLV